MYDASHISADVQRLSLNASCMTISGGRTEQLVIFCRVTGFYEWFSQFHSCGTYSVLSQSPSIVAVDGLSVTRWQKLVAVDDCF